MKKILYIQYANSACYPSLEHSSHILARKGWQILFLYVGSFSSSNNICLQRHKNITVHKLPYCTTGRFQQLRYIWFCLWALFWILCWRPKWIYASDIRSSLITLMLSYFPSVKVIYHEYDLPTLWQDERISNFIKLALWTRQKLAKRVEFCILPNNERMKEFKAEIGTDVFALSVWNCPMREEASFQRRSAAKEEIWLLYHGSIMPLRLPLTLVEAMKLLPDRVRLRIIGHEPIGSVGYIKALQEKARSLGLKEGRINFIGTVPTRSELLRYCREIDVGLAFMPLANPDINTRTMVGASNKPFEYLASGAALLVSDLPDWKRAYVEPGYGLACDPESAESIADRIQWFLEHPVRMRAMGEAGRKRILSEWNYEKEFEPVISRIREIDISHRRGF